MRTLLIVASALALAATCLAGTAAAAPPVGGCNAVTNHCWDGSLLCFWISQQVPFCVKDPGVLSAPTAACVTEVYNTQGDPAACGGLACIGNADGWTKCYGQPIPPCVNICI